MKCPKRFDAEYWEQIRVLALEMEKNYWKVRYNLLKLYGKL